jgi:hypothetical protein
MARQRETTALAEPRGFISILAMTLPSESNTSYPQTPTPTALPKWKVPWSPSRSLLFLLVRDFGKPSAFPAASEYIRATFRQQQLMSTLTPILCPFASGSQDETWSGAHHTAGMSRSMWTVLPTKRSFLASTTMGSALCAGERGVSKPKGLD